MSRMHEGTQEKVGGLLTIFIAWSKDDQCYAISPARGFKCHQGAGAREGPGGPVREEQLSHRLQRVRVDFCNVPLGRQTYHLSKALGFTGGVEHSQRPEEKNT